MEYRLKEIIDFKPGYAFKTTQMGNRGLNLIKIKSLKNNNVIFDNNNVKVEDDEKLKDYLIGMDDILMALTGDPVNKGNYETWVGRTCKYTHKEKAYLNQRICKLIPNQEIINKWYLYYWLIRYDKTYEIASLCHGSANQANISHKDVGEMTIDLPNIEIQNKVGDILFKLDKKIELNNKINDNLQELLNKVFTNWFCEYDYPNEADQPYKSSGGKMIESELGKIPANWRIGIFQDIIDFSNGYGFKSSDLLDNEEKETYKVFKQGNINLSGGINEEKTKSWFYKDKAKGLEKFILKKGDILMCMTDMKNSISPLLGHTALMNIDDEYIVNQRVGLIRCKKKITDYPYVYTMSNLEYFLKDIRSRANSGVQVNLSTNGICETKIVIPSKSILDKFNNFAKPLYEIMFNNQKESRNLEQLRDTLLPKLMNGEIDLDKIEI